MIRVLIFGAGAVGSYLGARLALTGATVAFIARGLHLEAMNTCGLRLTGPRGEMGLQQPLAVLHPGDVPWVPDICFLAVKTYDVAAAVAQLPDSVVKNSIIVTLQNGVSGAERVIDSLSDHARKMARVVSGIAYVSANIESPGHVTYISEMSSIVSGQLPGDNNLEGRLSEAMKNAGVPLKIEADIRRALWVKFLALATNAALTALSRSPAGIVYKDPDLLALTVRAIAEIGDVARAEGVAITALDEANALSQLCSLPADMFASMYHDLASGRQLEIADLSGTVSRLSALHGIKTPVHDTAWACLKPHAHC